MDFDQVIGTRRSVREYRPDPVPEAVLEKILNAARIAPSGSNRQPSRFIVIRAPETRQKMVALCEDQSFIAQAPVLIVACGIDIHYNRGHYMKQYSMLVDVAIAVDHLTLAARNEGLGTCWIGSFDNEGIKKFLGIPEDVQVVALTPLGYPSDASAFRTSSSRKKLKEIVFEETWPE